MGRATFEFAVVILAIVNALAQSDVPVSKLDRLSAAMVTVKSLTTSELDTLTIAQRTDSAEVATVLTDLTAQRSFYSTEKQQLTDQLAILQDATLAQLALKRNLTSSEISTLKAEIANANLESNAAQEQSKSDLEGLSADIDSLTNLAHRVADAVHQADVLAAAQAAQQTLPTIAQKHAYTGPGLTATCDSREEVTGVLSSLLQYLQTTLKQETQQSMEVAAMYQNYLNALNSQLSALQNVSVAYVTQQGNAFNNQQNINSQIADLNAKDSNLAGRINRLEQLQTWNLHAFTVRSGLIDQMQEQANLVVQMITLLQAKLAVQKISG